jgi:YD repeat-containing protein
MPAMEQVRVVAANSNEARMARFFWRSSLVMMVAGTALLLAGSLVHAQSNWVRPAPPLVGYVGSSPAPQLCQRTAPLDEGCWLGLDPELAIDKACALHGQARGAGTQALPGEKLFTAEVQCTTARVGIAGQPFYCDSSGRVQAKYRDAKSGKTALSCTPPPAVVNPAASMGCPGCKGARAAEGVNLAAGNAYRYETDFRSSANPLLEIRRVYNSKDARPRAFGFNWTGSYERRLEIYADQRVVAWRPDANIYYFDETRGRFSAESGVKDALVQVAGGKSDVAWRYTAAADGVVEEYDARGVLVGLRHPRGATVRLEYSDAAGQAGALMRVVDPAGRSISFAYDWEGRVSQAVDAQGRTYRYTYGGATGCRAPEDSIVACKSGNLTGVVAGDTRTRTYHYDEARSAQASLPRALTGITAAGGVREAAPWSYDLNGAAISAAKAGVRPVALKPGIAGAGLTMTATAR